MGGGDTNLSFFVGETYTQTKSYDVNDVGEDLERGMEPDYTSEGREADGDGAGGEEDDEGERGENTVGDQHFLRISGVA